MCFFFMFYGMTEAEAPKSIRKFDFFFAINLKQFIVIWRDVIYRNSDSLLFYYVLLFETFFMLDRDFDTIFPSNF